SGTSPLMKDVGTYSTALSHVIITNANGEVVTDCYNIGAFKQYTIQILRLEINEYYTKLDDLIAEGYLNDGIIEMVYDTTKYSLYEYTISYKDIYGQVQYLTTMYNPYGTVEVSVFDQVRDFFEIGPIEFNSEVLTDSRTRTLQNVESLPYMFVPPTTEVLDRGVVVSSTNMVLNQTSYTLRIRSAEVSVDIPTEYLDFYFDNTSHSLNEGYIDGQITTVVGANSLTGAQYMTREQFADEFLFAGGYPSGTVLLLGETRNGESYTFKTKEDSEAKPIENTNLRLGYFDNSLGRYINVDNSNFNFVNRNVNWKVSHYNYNVISEDYYEAIRKNSSGEFVPYVESHDTFLKTGYSQATAKEISVFFDGEYHGTNRFYIYGSTPELGIDTDSLYVPVKNGEYYTLTVGEFTISFKINDRQALIVNETINSSLNVEYIDYNSISIVSNLTGEKVNASYYYCFFNLFDHYKLRIEKAIVDIELFNQSEFEFVYDGKIHSFNSIFEGDKLNALNQYLKDNFGIYGGFKVINKADSSNPNAQKLSYSDIVRNVSDVALPGGADYIVSPEYYTSSYSSKYFTNAGGNAADNFDFVEYYYTYEITKRPLKFTFNPQGDGEFNYTDKLYYKDYDGVAIDWNSYDIDTSYSTLAYGDNFYKLPDTMSGDGRAKYVIKDNNTDALLYVDIFLDPQNTFVYSPIKSDVGGERNYTTYELVSFLVNYDLSANYLDYGTAEQRWDAWSVCIRPYEVEYLATGEYIVDGQVIELTKKTDASSTVEISFVFDDNNHTFNEIFTSGQINKVIYRGSKPTNDTVESMNINAPRIKYVDDNGEYLGINYEVYSEDYDGEKYLGKFNITDSYIFEDVTYILNIKPKSITLTSNYVSTIAGTDFTTATNDLKITNTTFDNKLVDYYVNQDFIDYLDSGVVGAFRYHYNGSETRIYDIKLLASDAVTATNPNGDVSSSYDINVYSEYGASSPILRVTKPQITFLEGKGFNIFEYAGKKVTNTSVTINMDPNTNVKSSGFISVKGAGDYSVRVNIDPNNELDLISVGQHQVVIRPEYISVYKANGELLDSSLIQCDDIGRTYTFTITPKKLTISSRMTSLTGDAKDHFYVLTFDGEIYEADIDERLKVSGLISGDILRINDVNYSSSTKSYNLINERDLEDGRVYLMVPTLRMLNIVDSRGNSLLDNYEIEIIEHYATCVFEELEL
ncbi:MAG: hypothetical protein MJZ37_07255, partial [Bacilli bacterium]|nr:hypothetical protein [Bacilli bacterium]